MLCGVCMGCQRLTAAQREAVIQFTKVQDVLFHSQLASPATIAYDYDFNVPGRWGQCAKWRPEVGWE